MRRCALTCSNCQGRTATVRSQIGRDYRVSVIVALQQLAPDIAGLLRAPTPVGGAAVDEAVEV